MAVTKIKPVKSTLSKALDYIENPDKTDEKMLISSFGCSYETADIEFGYTLSQARDKGNNLAFHLIQSFAPGEVDYQKAHEIGRQLADAVTKGQHEYVLTTHIDKGHIHNHIIFCAVNFVDHHKYVSNKRTYYGIRNMSDKLCRDNGLSVVVPGKGSKGKSYAEYQAEKTGTSWKGKLKIAVDALTPQVSSFEELLQRLQAAGYEIKPGKYISCRAPGQERFTRLKTLGADYTEEAIRERIAGKGDFPFLKETVVFPHGKGAIPVRAVEIFLALMDGTAAPGAFADRGLFLPARESRFAFVGGGVFLYQLPRHSFNALHKLPSVGGSLCDLRQIVFPFGGKLRGSQHIRQDRHKGGSVLRGDIVSIINFLLLAVFFCLFPSCI